MTGDGTDDVPAWRPATAREREPQQDDVRVQDVLHGASAGPPELAAPEPGGPGQARLGELGPPPPIEVRRGDLSMLGGQLTIAPQRSALVGPTATIAGAWVGAALVLGPVLHGGDPTYVDQVLHVLGPAGGGFAGALGGTALALRTAWHVSYEVSDGTIRAVRDGKVVAIHETSRVVALKFNRYAGFLGSLLGGTSRYDDLPQSRNKPDGRVASPYLQLWLDDRTASHMQVFPPMAIWGRERMQAAERDLRRACGLADEP